MTAEEHNKTLATLYFVYSGIHGLTLIGLLLLVLVVKLTTPVSELITSFWLFVGIAVFVILFLVVAVLPMVVGYGFRKRAGWLKPVAFVTAILSVVNIPIGTALGIYTIRFFRSEGGVKMYGGRASSTAEGELKNAMHGAQPLMNWADRLK